MINKVKFSSFVSNNCIFRREILDRIMHHLGVHNLKDVAAILNVKEDSDKIRKLYESLRSWRNNDEDASSQYIHRSIVRWLYSDEDIDANYILFGERRVRKIKNIYGEKLSEDSKAIIRRDAIIKELRSVIHNMLLILKSEIESNAIKKEENV